MSAAAPPADRPPPGSDAPVRLYSGSVMHQRMKPVGHRFSYTVFSLMIDLDRLAEADRLSPLFSVNRANLVSFFEADHLRGRPGPTLRAAIDRLLAEAGLAAPAARIRLACFPRIFGQVFNPLSIYYAYDAEDRLVALVYEVRNTFGEHHSYVRLVRPGELTAAGLRQTATKRFHVSPFIGTEAVYRFRLNLPAETLHWRILETDRSGPLLAATYKARRRPFTTAALAGCLLRIPFLPWKIVGGIHFEALRLWLKGVRYHTRPEAPPAASFGEGQERAVAHAPRHIRMPDMVEEAHS